MSYGVSNGHVTDDVTWPPKVLWGSTVGYPSDSLASCFKCQAVGEMFLLHKDHTFAVYKPWPTYCGVDVANVVVLLWQTFLMMANINKYTTCWLLS